VYTPLTAPVRVTPANGQAITPGPGVDVTVAGCAGCAPSTAQAVVINLTSANNSEAGWLQVSPTGQSTTSSAVNYYYPNQLTSTLVTVQVGTGTGANKITVATHVNTTFFVDEQGYYDAPASGSTAGQYKALPPARACDTRADQPGVVTNQCNNGGTGSPLQSNGTLRVQVTGAGGVPATGVSAAVVNITAANDPNPGFLVAYPNTRPDPGSSVNYNGNSTHSAGLPCPGSGISASTGCDITANRDIVKLDSAGGFTIFAHQGPVDVVVDVNGYFTDNSASTGQLFSSAGVSRPCDTRQGCSGTLVARGTLNVLLWGHGVPTGASAAVLTVTIDKTTPVSAPHPANTGPGVGFLTIFPGPPGTTEPNASDLNFAANSIVPSHVYATLGTDGSVNITNNSDNPIDVVVDVYGYFTGPNAGGATPFHVAVSANPNTVTADGSSTSTVSAVVTDANGNGVSGDHVSVAVTGTGCGTISNPSPAGSSATSGTTDGTGHVTFTYTAGTGAGTCTVTATEATNSQSGSATITQTGAALTLTPATQSVPADNTSPATLTATALNLDGTPRAGQTVTFTITSGPNAGGAGATNLGNPSKQCTTDASGKCTITYTSKLVGTDNVSASYTFNSTTYTASATITYTPGQATKICIGPTDYQPPSSFCVDTTLDTFAWASQAIKINSQATVTATAYDQFNNPVPGASIVFTRYFAPASAYGNGSPGTEAASMCDPAGSHGTSGCTVVTNQPVTANAIGHANYTFTESQQGQDEVRAQVQTSTGQAFSGWTVVTWGLSSITITPSYPAAFNNQQVNTPVSYQVNSQTDAGTPNLNCVELAFAENSPRTGLGQTPYADQFNPSAAYFASVSGGSSGTAKAFSSSSCSGTQVDFSTQKPKVIYVIPAPNGTFSFTINSQATTLASPIGAANSSAGGGDFEYSQCNDFLGPCGPTAIGQTVQYGAPTQQTASIQPTSAATVAAGGVRDYSISNSLSGADNTNPNFPNAVSFQELVNGNPTPGVIAYTSLTSGGITYCVQGYPDPQTGTEPSPTRASTQCPAPDATHVTKPAGTQFAVAGQAQHVTVTYSKYNGTGTNFSEVQVAGIGTFSVRITDKRGCTQTTDNPNGYCTGTATPVTWIEQNSDTTLDAGEPNAVGGSLSFDIPTGSGVFLLTHNFAANGPGNNDTTTPNGGEDRFSDGQFYNPIDPTPNAGQNQDILAQVTDQSGNEFVGNTNYGVKWTITNNGALATKVYLQDASNADTPSSFVLHTPPNETGIGGDKNLGDATTDHFVNPTTGTNNKTIPKGTAVSGTYGTVNGSITIPGGASLTFTSYTLNGGQCGNFMGSVIDCALIEISSNSATQATVTAQLTDASTFPGANIGSPASDKYNWVTTPNDADTVNGTIRAFDPIEPAADPNGTHSDNPDDFIVVHTSVGDRLVQFGRGDSSALPPTETYHVSGSSANEDQFEAALANGKNITITNANCSGATSNYNPGGAGSAPSCLGAQDNAVS
jgi:hypothetical protein